jgi:hypothetical protein
LDLDGVRLDAEHAAGVGRQRHGQNRRARHRAPRLPPPVPQLRPPERRCLPATTAMNEPEARGWVTSSPPLQVKHGEEEKEWNPSAYPPNHNDPPPTKPSAALLAPGFLLILLTTAAGKAKPPRTCRTGEAGPTHRARRGGARDGGTAEAARRRRRWSCDADAVEGAGRSGPVPSGRWMATGPYGPARSA